MPIKSHKLGPGTLTLGAGALQVNAQLTSGRITPSENVQTTEAVKVLSGEELAAEETATLTYVLEGNFLQDLDAAGVVAWSWANATTYQEFTFTPNTAASADVTGEVRVIPISVGGDEADARMSSDFSWSARDVDFAPGP